MHIATMAPSQCINRARVYRACVLQGVQVPPRGAADRRRVQGAARLRPYGAHAAGRPQELPPTPPTR